VSPGSDQGTTDLSWRARGPSGRCARGGRYKAAGIYDELLAARSFASELLIRGRAHGGTGSGLDADVAAGWLSCLLAVAATGLGDHAGALVWCSDAERHGRDRGCP